MSGRPMLPGSTRIGVAAAAALLAVAAGCTKKNSDFCCTTVEACQRHGGGSELTECSDPARPFCDNEGQYGPGRTCIAPPGEPCGPDGECDDPATPICFEGLCVECAGADDCPFSDPVCGALDHQCASCSDGAECAAFADRPFCDQGACVGCRDGADCQQAAAPVCDPASGTCRGCTAGAECPSEVCDWQAGACVAAEEVLYVATDGDGEACTRAAPCGSLTTAIEVAAGAARWIRMAPGEYQEAVDLDGGDISIAGDGASLRPDAIDSPVFAVRGGAALRVSGLRIHDADGNGDGPGDGVYCTDSGGDSSVILDRVVIEGNDDQGVDASSCDLIVTRSVVRDNRRGGLAMENVDFSIFNNFIVQNGSGAAVSAGVLVDKQPPSAGRLEHNTIVANVSSGGSPSGIQCVLVGSLLTFRNNIIRDNLGSATQVDGDNCEHHFSVIGPDPVDGPGNLDAAPSFAGDGDFHLAEGSTGIDAAEDSDVVVDIDGEPRPGGAGNDIGADEYSAR